ncbi:MAG: hypothetical protein AAF468_15000 [Pseudomonadota bacterium]
MRTFLIVLSATVAAALWNSIAGAQAPVPKQNAPKQNAIPLDRGKETAKQDLDELFANLKREGDRKRAQRISQQIWANWFRSDSKSTDLLTGWARKAMADKKFAVALDLLDQAIVLNPGYAEAWNQRATLHFMMDEYGKSISDIERVLELEPRHYGALSGLGMILQRMERKKEALEIWHRVLAIYPAMDSAQKAVIELEDELTGNRT